MIETPSHAIALLGGYKAVAGRTSRPLTTVASWATRESIPVDAWGGLIAFAQEKGLDGFSYEELARAHAQRQSKPRRRAAPKKRTQPDQKRRAA